MSTIVRNWCCISTPHIVSNYSSVFLYSSYYQDSTLNFTLLLPERRRRHFLIFFFHSFPPALSLFISAVSLPFSLSKFIFTFQLRCYCGILVIYCYCCPLFAIRCTVIFFIFITFCNSGRYIWRLFVCLYNFSLTVADYTIFVSKFKNLRLFCFATKRRQMLSASDFANELQTYNF